jgi:putative phage-type endonuclease
MSQRKLPPNFLQVEQGTPEWLIARVGCVTASRIKDVVAVLKNGKSSAARETYKMEVLTEILTGRATDHYVSQPMEFGLENEPLARTSYEIEYGVETEKVGFVLHPTIKRSGCSPDGLVGDDGLVEIKVPNTTTHLTYLIEGIVPEDYIPQMQWQMACTGRQWCDFVSYDPRLPQEFGLFVIRLKRDDAVIADMEAKVQTFINEVGEMCQKLNAHKAAVKAPDPTYIGPPRAEIPVNL